VPDDIAVIGFDNWQLILAGSRTPFPSVDMNMFDLGRVAAQAAMGLRDDGPGVHFRPCTLVAGGTQVDVDDGASGLLG
jgi:LacI family transcriptional regulator